MYVGGMFCVLLLVLVDVDPSYQRSIGLVIGRRGVRVGPRSLSVRVKDPPCRCCGVNPNKVRQDVKRGIYTNCTEIVITEIDEEGPMICHRACEVVTMALVMLALTFVVSVPIVLYFVKLRADYVTIIAADLEQRDNSVCVYKSNLPFLKPVPIEKSFWKRCECKVCMANAPPAIRMIYQQQNKTN